MKYPLTTTTWKNGCALASVSTVLTSKLESPEWSTYANSQGGQSLLESFRNVYQDLTLNWEKITQIVKSYHHPQDQQIFWIPALRIHLRKVLLSNHDYRDRLFQTFSAALRQYVIEGEVPSENEYLNVFNSNKSYFEQFKHDCRNLTSRQKKQKFDRASEKRNLENYWQRSAYPHYCEYMGRIEENCPMITAEELSLLSSDLHIHLRVMGANSEIDGGNNGFTGDHPLGQLTAVCTNNHWQPKVEFVQQQTIQDTLWKYGTSLFAQQSISQLRQEINNRRELDSRKKEALNSAISSCDISALLRFFNESPEIRNTLLYTLATENKYELLNSVLRYAAAIPSEMNEPGSNWKEKIKSELSPIDDITGDSELHNAVRQNQIEKALRLIRAGKSIYETNAKKVSPLHLVCALGTVRILEGIIQIELEKATQLGWFKRKTSYYGLDMTKQDAAGETPLHYAASSSVPQMLATLFANNNLVVNYDMGLQNNVKRTPLHYAASHPSQENIQLLLRLPGFSLAKLDQQDQWGLTALHYSTLMSRIENVKLILAAGADQYINADPQSMKRLFPEQKIAEHLSPLWIALELAQKELISTFIFPKKVWMRTRLTASSIRLVDLGLHNLAEVGISDGRTAIHLAAHFGWLELLQKWSNEFSPQQIVGCYDDNGRTAIHSAAQGGQLEVLKFLLSIGATLDTLDNQGNQPLHLAAERGHVEVVAYICARAQAQAIKPINLRAKNKFHQSAHRLAKQKNHSAVIEILTNNNAHDNFEFALEAISVNDIPQLTRLITQHPNLLTEHDEEQNSLLHYVVLEGTEGTKELINLLINAGMSVDVTNREGQTPLFLAAALSNNDLLEHLILKRADVKHQDAKNLTALHLAANNNNVVGIRILLGHGAYLDHINKDGLTPLHMATIGKHVEAFDELQQGNAVISRCVHPSFVQSRMHTNKITVKTADTLWLALEFGCAPLIKKIVDLQITANQSIDVDGTISSLGNTLLHYFAFHGELNYFSTVARRSYYPFAANELGLTPLHIAAQLGHLDIVRHIMEVVVPHPGIIASTPIANFNIEAKTEKGETAWLLAENNKQQKVMDYLVTKGARQVAGPNTSKGIAKRTHEYIQKQNEFSSELEQTLIFQVLNGGRMVLPAVMCYAAGPVPMALVLAQQLISCSTFPVINGVSTLYYSAKPFVHNYTHWTIEKGLDSVASLTSNTVAAGLSVVRLSDWATSPIRKTVGYSTSLLLANLATNFTDNKQLQAASYFMGREIGMGLVDAYHYYAKTATLDPNNPSFNYELNKGYDIWISILGKARGEQFVQSMHSITQLQNDLYQLVGLAEHNAIDAASQQIENFNSTLKSFESYNKLTHFLTLGCEILAPVQGVVSSADILFSKLQYAQREIANYREQLIQDIEAWIYENALSEGSYRNTALQYLMQTQLQLLNNKVHEAELDQSTTNEELNRAKDAFNKCEETEEQCKIAAGQQLDKAKQAHELAHSVYEALVLQKGQLETRIQQAWAQSPKGIQTEALKTASDNQFQAQVNKEIAQLELSYQDKLGSNEQERLAAQNKLDDAESELQKCTKALQQAEQAFLEVITPLEKAEYDKNEIKRQSEVNESLTQLKNQHSDHLDKSIILNQAVTSVFDARLATEQSEYAYNGLLAQLKVINDKIYKIDNPGRFIAKEAVYNALLAHGYNNPTAVAKHIIDQIVATGAIDEPEAMHRMESTFVDAQDTRKPQPALELKVTELWLALRNDYRANFVLMAQALKIKIEAEKSHYQNVLTHLNNEQQKLDVAKNQFQQTLAGEDQKSFEEKFNQQLASNEDLFWKAAHPEQANKQVLALLGQVGLSAEILNDQSQSLNPSHQKIFKCDLLANWLLDYKYLFLAKPTVDAKLAEVTALSLRLQSSPLTAESIALEKNIVEKQIATGITQTAISEAIAHHDANGIQHHSEMVSASAVAQLQRSLSFDSSEALLNIDWKALETTLTGAFANNNLDAVSNVIVQTLQENARIVSENEICKWEAPKPVPVTPAPVPESSPAPKKKRHGLSRILHKVGNAAVHVGKVILAGAAQNGVGVVVNSSGVGGGFTHQQQFNLASFKPAPVLFQLPEKTWANDPVYHPSSAVPVNATKLSGAPLPTIFPHAPWKPPTTVVPLLSPPTIPQRLPTSKVQVLPTAKQPSLPIQNPVLDPKATPLGPLNPQRISSLTQALENVERREPNPGSTPIGIRFLNLLVPAAHAAEVPAPAPQTYNASFAMRWLMSWSPDKAPVQPPLLSQRAATSASEPVLPLRTYMPSLALGATSTYMPLRAATTMANQATINPPVAIASASTAISVDPNVRTTRSGAIYGRTEPESLLSKVSASNARVDLFNSLISPVKIPGFSTYYTAGTRRTTIDDHLLAIGRSLGGLIGIGLDVLSYPLEMAEGAALQAWDGYNAIGDQVLGVSTEDARQRNRERGIAFHHDVVMPLQNGGVERTEAISNVVLPLIFGGIAGRASRRPGPSNIDLYHSVTSPTNAQSILQGVNPRFLNPGSRFGEALYLSEVADTTLYELNHHGAIATHTIRYTIDTNQLRILDLTKPKIAAAFDYFPSMSDKYPQLRAKAIEQGYNAIKYPSERHAGNINLALLKDFDKLKPQMVVPSEILQSIFKQKK